MFERSPRARQVVVLAQERRATSSTTTSAPSTSSWVCSARRRPRGARAGVRWTYTVSGVRAPVVRIVGSGEGGHQRPDPVHAAAKKVLELALREALAWATTTSATEHILLGLVARTRASPRAPCATFDADSEKIRNEVIRIAVRPGGRRQGGGQTAGAGAGAGRPAGRRKSPSGSTSSDATSAKLASDGKPTPWSARDRDRSGS